MCTPIYWPISSCSDITDHYKIKSFWSHCWQMGQFPASITHIIISRIKCYCLTLVQPNSPAGQNRIKVRLVRTNGNNKGGGGGRRDKAPSPSPNFTLAWSTLLAFGCSNLHRVTRPLPTTPLLTRALDLSPDTLSHPIPLYEAKSNEDYSRTK